MATIIFLNITDYEVVLDRQNNEYEFRAVQPVPAKEKIVSIDASPKKGHGLSSTIGLIATRRISILNIKPVIVAEHYR